MKIGNLPPSYLIAFHYSMQHYIGQCNNDSNLPVIMIILRCTKSPIFRSILPSNSSLTAPAKRHKSNISATIPVNVRKPPIPPAFRMPERISSFIVTVTNASFNANTAKIQRADLLIKPDVTFNSLNR